MPRPRKAIRQKPTGLNEGFLHELADILASTSGSFQKDRFLAACGVESVKECQNG